MIVSPSNVGVSVPLFVNRVTSDECNLFDVSSLTTSCQLFFSPFNVGRIKGWREQEEERKPRESWGGRRGVYKRHAEGDVHFASSGVRASGGTIQGVQGLSYLDRSTGLFISRGRTWYPSLSVKAPLLKQLLTPCSPWFFLYFRNDYPDGGGPDKVLTGRRGPPSHPNFHGWKYPELMRGLGMLVDKTKVIQVSNANKDVDQSTNCW